MLYAGGTCDKSNQCQDPDKFSCQDFNGGPPDGFGFESYVLATGEGGEDPIFYSGPVMSGTRFLMQNNMERFPADQQIRVYSCPEQTDSCLLQDLTYHSSCSQNLDLLNRFGSMVIAGWFNEEQGNITGFDNVTAIVDATIDLTADLFSDGPATVQTLSILETRTETVTGIELPATFYNLTSSVAGTVLNPGDEFRVEAAIPIDLSLEYRYEFLVTMTATKASGQVCTGNGLLEFTRGGLPELEAGGPSCEAIYDQNWGGGGGGGKDKDKGGKDKRDRD
jgi:hypothetical protein